MTEKCPTCGQEMPLSETFKKAREEVVGQLKDDFAKFQEELANKLIAMEQAESPREATRIKRGIMLAFLENIPIKGMHCIYCGVNRVHGLAMCKECGYGIVHKPCDSVDSDYKTILRGINDLEQLIHDRYYTGEEK